MKPRISIFTSIEGHSSISQAISDHLSNHYQITTNLHYGPEFHAYKAIYKYYPPLFALPFHTTRFTPFRQLSEFYETLTFHNSVAKQIQAQQPHLIICTWFLTNHVIEKIALSTRTPFITVIANPRTNHPMETAPQSTNATFDHTASNIIHNLGVPQKNIVETGWFVRSQFKPTPNKAAIRNHLNLNPNHLTFLFASGSEGLPRIINTITHLKNITHPTQLVFACGANTQLLNYARQLAPNLNTSSKLTLIPLPFTTQIHKYIQAADLVIGKAGPNFIFESVACHTPFMITSHIAGTETGNLDIVRDYHIGTVQENHAKAAQYLQSIIQNPTQLNQFTPHLKKLALHNDQAGSKLLKLVTQLI